jgi:hypothetical protein
MSGIVGGMNLRSSGLVNNSSAADGQLFTGTGAGLPAGFEAAAGGGSAILQMIAKQDGTIRTDTTDSTYVAASGYLWSELTLAITPASSSNYLWVIGSLGITAHSSYSCGYWITFHVAGGTETPFQGDTAHTRAMTGMVDTVDSGSDRGPPASVSILYHPNTTSEVTIRVRTQATNTGYPLCFHQCKDGTTNADDGGNMCSNLMVMEIDSGISPSISNTFINST